MHGGIGVTYDHDIHLYLRRVTVDRRHARLPGRSSPANHHVARGGRGMTTTERGSAMSATDMESVESFRERAREWLAANVEKGPTAGNRLPTGETEEEELALIATRARAPAQVLRSRVRGHLLPEGVRRSGPLARAPARVQRGGRGLRVPEHPPDPDVRAVRGGAAGVRHRGTEEAPPPQDHERRGDLDAVPLRAQWRFRRGRARSPPRRATATSGSSTVRRSGRPARGSPTTGSACCARTGTCRSTAA